MKIKFKNLLSELEFLIIIITMIIVISVLVVSLLIVSQRMLSDLRSRSIITANEMTALIENPLYTVDDQQAVHIGETFLSSGKISSILLESDANGVILSKTSGRISSHIPQISRNIYRNKLLLGKITMAFSDEEIAGTRSRFIVISLITIIAGLLASLAASKFIISGRISKPFETVVSGIRNISEGNYGIQVDQTPYQDLNILVSLFNDMAKKVNQKNSEQKKIEETLKESENKTRAIFNSSFSFAGVLSPDGTVVDVNRTALEFAGINLDDVSGKKFWETPWWTHSAKVQEDLITALGAASRGEIARFETTHIAADGSCHDIDVSIKPVIDEKGNVIMLVPEGRDITHRKKAEEQLRTSEEKYRELVESSNSIILRMDNVGKITFFNEYASKFFGFSRDEITGRNVVGTIVPFTDSSGKNLEQMILDIAINPERYISNENENICKDGKRVWVAWTNRPVLDDLGKCIEIQCIGNDITGRKHAEEELLQSNERFKSLSDASLEGIMIHEQGTILDANLAFLKLFGYDTLSELAGKNGLETILTSESRERIRQRIDHQETGTIEITCKRRDGATFTGETDSRPIKYLGRDARLVSCRDITERKRTEEENLKLNAQLVQAQKMESVGRLAGGVAHDFNNMLSAIQGHTELAMMNIPQSDPVYGDLKAIYTAARRSADLTRQLLAFARKQAVSPKVLDVNDTVTGMLKMLLRLLGEDISLAWIPGSGLWPAKVDPSQIDQILVNLCINARDAINGVGRITIETDNLSFDEDYCTAHPGSERGEYIMLAVTDNGCGMSKEVLDHLFEPFFTTKEIGKGTGLGLATVYGIIKQNKGFINVHSEEGNGTTIKVYLPKYKGEHKEIIQENIIETPMGKGETILVVEDEAIILDVTQAMLEKLKYNVLTAGSPGAAIKLVKAYPGEIHLLITDVVMPEMNGRELSTVLNEIKPEMKCLYASGYTANAIAHHGVLDEGVNFIPKPFSMHDLAVKTRDALT